MPTLHGERLLAAATELRSRLHALGWDTGTSESQIIPLIIGAAEPAVEIARRLGDAGYFVPAIRPPTVPMGESLLRLSLCYHHTEEMLDALVGQLGRLR